MFIIKNALFQLQSCGYVTLQIPNIEIDTTGNHPTEYEEIPDEWVNKLGSTHALAVERESYFLFFSRKGYEANKQKLKEALEQAISQGKDRTQGQGWSVFEKMAEKHFAEVEQKTLKKITNMERKLKALKASFLVL